MSLPIATLKALALKHDMTHVIVFSVAEDGKHWVASYGSDVDKCSVAANWANKLKEHMKWPESLMAQPSTVKRLKKKVAKLEAEIRDLKG